MLGAHPPACHHVSMHPRASKHAVDQKDSRTRQETCAILTCAHHAVRSLVFCVHVRLIIASSCAHRDFLRLISPGHLASSGLSSCCLAACVLPCNPSGTGTPCVQVGDRELRANEQAEECRGPVAGLTASRATAVQHPAGLKHPAHQRTCITLRIAAMCGQPRVYCTEDRGPTLSLCCEQLFASSDHESKVRCLCASTCKQERRTNSSKSRSAHQEANVEREPQKPTRSPVCSGLACR